MPHSPTNSDGASRSLYWDVVRGIGIIAIVLGHTGYFGGAFVYLFHVALFFFISGFLFDAAKYPDPFRLFARRISSCWVRFVVYAAGFVFIHNFLLTRGLIADTELYNHTTMLAKWLHSFTLQTTEQMQGALWFVPVWAVSSALFAGCVKAARKVQALSAKEMPRTFVGPDADRPAGMTLPDKTIVILTGLFACLLGLAGAFLTMRGTGAAYNMQAALTVIPVYFAAWLMRLYLPGFRKYTTWYGWLLSGALMHFLNTQGILIDLVSLKIPGLLYYPVTLLGIYHALCLGNLIEKCRPAARTLAVIGRHSFDIMAIHFTVFKLLDYAYFRLVPGAVPENLSAFPVAFRYELGPAYILFGVAVPVLIGLLADRAEAVVRNR